MICWGMERVWCEDGSVCEDGNDRGLWVLMARGLILCGDYEEMGRGVYMIYQGLVPELSWQQRFH